MTRIHLIISGGVQGVGYRAWARRFAEEKSITGWVRNRADGTVEITAEGEKPTLEKFIIHCRKGPDVGWVETVDIVWEKTTGEYERFTVLH